MAARELPLRAHLYALETASNSVPASASSTGPANHVLLLVLHHIAGDGWSLRPLLRDLGALYRARVEGTASLRFDEDARRSWPGAQFIVRVRAERIYPNCPRYIHQYRMVSRSVYVPRVEVTPPVPDWKRAEWARDVLPAGDPAADPGEERR